MPNTALAEARPRRSRLSSTTSSCSSVAVWMNSTQAASFDVPARRRSRTAARRRGSAAAAAACRRRRRCARRAAGSAPPGCPCARRWRGCRPPGRRRTSATSAVSASSPEAPRAGARTRSAGTDWRRRPSWSPGLHVWRTQAPYRRARKQGQAKAGGIASGACAGDVQRSGAAVVPDGAAGGCRHRARSCWMHTPARWRAASAPSRAVWRWRTRTSRGRAGCSRRRARSKVPGPLDRCVP